MSNEVAASQSKPVASITLSARHRKMLETIAQAEGVPVDVALGRGIDMLWGAYSERSQKNDGPTLSSIDQRLNYMERHLMFVLLEITRHVLQCLYFVTLPLKTGPITAKLNTTGYKYHWEQSQHFAELIMLPTPKSGTTDEAQTS